MSDNKHDSRKGLLHQTKTKDSRATTVHQILTIIYIMYDSTSGAPIYSQA